LSRAFTRIGALGGAVAVAALALAALAIGAVWAGPAAAAEGGKQTVSIGFLAYRGAEDAKRNWQPTADYLAGALPGYKFTVTPYSHAELRAALAADEVAFVLTNTGDYVDLEATFGISRIATLRSAHAARGGNAFGAVIFTRAERADIQTLADLRGKSFAAVAAEAFGGFQMAWRELKVAGVDPFAHLADLRFLGFPQDRIVRAVLAGEADAGTVRGGLLEAMAAEGKIRLGDVRVLNPQNQPGYPLALSTRLYPEWPFAVARHTPPELAGQVAIALLSMPADHPAATAAGYGGWTAPLDYQPVHDLFRELGLGPYAAGDEDWADFMARNRIWLAVALGLFALVVVHSVGTEYMVGRRTHELSALNLELQREIAERRAAEEKVRRLQSELAHAGRLKAMGEMATTLAHELNQPLSAIASYTQGCIRRLQSGTARELDLLGALEQAAAQARRAGQIIGRIRAFVRKDSPHPMPIDLNRAVREVVELLVPDLRDHGIALRLDLTEPLPEVAGDLIELEQVIFNLAHNAIEAMAGGAAETAADGADGQRQMRIVTYRAGTETVAVTVEDSGPGIDAAIADRLFESFATTKPDGLGLGLAICQSIVDTYGGRIEAANRPVEGARFRVILPTAEAAARAAAHAASAARLSA
jgi:two-component system, LuxR family, sensor histidine kinase TtrS